MLKYVLRREIKKKKTLTLLGDDVVSLKRYSSACNNMKGSVNQMKKNALFNIKRNMQNSINLCDCRK